MTEPSPPTGIITMAFGAQRYLDQAMALARSVRRHMPGHPICLVTDKPLETPLFDDVVIMDPIGVPGTVLKTLIYDYSPYDETLFIDSDCILVRDVSDHIERMRAWEFTPVCNSYLEDGDSDLWLEDVGAALRRAGGTRFPKFNGGVYFFRKSAHAREVFERARDLLEVRADYGVLDFDAAGPGEETLIGLALVQMGAGPLYDDDFGLMRTPLNSEGAIIVDPLRGRSRMRKNGRQMSPAIMHFCGAYAHHPSYRIARQELERDAPLNPAETTAIRARWYLDKLRSRIRKRSSPSTQSGQANP